ncbi:AAA family ATPase [Erysipelotrichaceae bacterium MTC7]|nr:AAA family ATPase [Erysipelotrichaceae bacterium MTC7]
MKFTELQKRLSTLVIFRSLLSEPIVIKLRKLLDTNDQDVANYIDLYCDFCATLFDVDTNMSRYLYRYVMRDENVYVSRIAQAKPIENILHQCLLHELRVIQELSQLTSESVLRDLPYPGYLPKWKTTKYQFRKDYLHKMERLPIDGYGVFAKYHVFRLEKQGLLPVHHPDPQSLHELIGYRRERKQVEQNTVAFLQGMKASNALLYGDAGTGKSSTVKAIANAYKDQGLRLIEVSKQLLHRLPELMDELAKNPLKFIIFIDDLSFNRSDDNFVALKTILEGGVGGRQTNVLIYATTNRRHFVKESMKDRNADELFTNDSIQETMSLAARFGLTITFQKPNKDLYLEIVQGLARENQLSIEGDELITQAEMFALRNNGRSPRTAKQFVEMQKIQEDLEK